MIWWLWRKPRRGLMRVVVYTRSDCPLCDTAAEYLAREQRLFTFELQFVDIASDPELVAEHGDSIPVIEVNGEVRFRGTINPMLWRRLVRAEQGDGAK
jgi:glutaredoxin